MRLDDIVQSLSHLRVETAGGPNAYLIRDPRSPFKQAEAERERQHMIQDLLEEHPFGAIWVDATTQVIADAIRRKDTPEDLESTDVSAWLAFGLPELSRAGTALDVGGWALLAGDVSFGSHLQPLGFLPWTADGLRALVLASNARIGIVSYFDNGTWLVVAA
jgi:hypothetical protein